MGEGMRFSMFGCLISFTLVLGLTPRAQASIGIDEKLQEPVPLDATFKDEDGQDIKLQDLLGQPILLALVYYRCPSICNVLLSGVADLVEMTDLVPGKDFRVVTISFNEEESPELAKRKKNNYFKRMRRKVPPEAWRFLTGSAESIHAVTDASGFRYKRTGKDFQHPAALIVLSPDGKIARYLYGVKFQPFDAKLAIYEASQGRSGPTINRVLLFCFSYDPEGKTYTFNILKVTGMLTMVVAAMFLTFLLLTTRRHRRLKEKQSSSDG